MDDDWRHQAACRGTDPDIFFPNGTTGPMWREVERAIAICRTCPVQGACREWALRTNQDVGVWGGMTENERRACAHRHGGSRSPDRRSSR